MYRTVFRRPRARWLPALGIAVTLGACSTLPEAVLLPISAPGAGTSEVDMLVATTRKREDTGAVFSGERSTTINFAEIGMSIPPDSVRKVGEVQWPRSRPGNPAMEFVTTKVDVLDAPAAYRRFNELIGRPGNDGRAIVFVHGFNNRFEEAVFRFAQIVHDSKAPGVPVLFAWPSRGSVTAYPYDRESANYSRDALEAVLSGLARDKRVKEVSVLAHSMGNWLTMEALRTMALKHGRVHPKIGPVMLAAPDVDIDVFRQQMLALGPHRPDMNLFVSSDDVALRASRLFWGGQPRLGSINPEDERYKDEIREAKVNVLDLTKVANNDPLKHGKFAQSPEIVRLIGYRLSQGQVLEEGGGLGERMLSAATTAGARVGNIAGQVVTAPAQLVGR